MIYTFYSYKGGVGRSMALANVAALMVRWGRKVLMVDWDLEAPGLEKFFESSANNISDQSKLRFENINKPGVVDLLYSQMNNSTLCWKDCIQEISVSGKPLHLITAGEKTPDYQSKVQGLNWEDLFSKHNIGNYIDSLRNEWIRQYDYVLIDSRTGITDIGDICTVLFPDALILLFVSNTQNVDGIKRIMERARKAHSKLPVDRSRLLGVPVPCRDEVYNERKKAQEWKEIFAHELGQYYIDFLPREITPREAVSKLFIPYVTNWSFGERLPIVEDENDVRDPASISSAYARLTSLLMNELDWSSVDSQLDPHELKLVREKAFLAEKQIESEKKRRRFYFKTIAVLLMILISSSYFFVHKLTDLKRKTDVREILYKFETTHDNAGLLKSLTSLNEQGISLAGIDIKDSSLQHIHLRGADLKKAGLSNTILSHSILIEADLRGADLSEAHLFMAELDRANLSDARLADINLSKAMLPGANLRGADLSKANLTGANLTGANLTGANLTGANLFHASLAGAVLTGANFNRTNFNGAILTRANLTGTNLNGASFIGANLDGAIGVENLDRGSIREEGGFGPGEFGRDEFK